jgi:hypothetical protein
MNAAGKPITFDAVAHEARVSRSWLYTQDHIRAEIERLRGRRRPTNPSANVPDGQRASDASLLWRLEAAIDRIRRLEGENRELREALALALGEHRAAVIRSGPQRSKSS